MPGSTLSYAARAAFCIAPIAKRLLQLMDKKRTNLGLSADVISAAHLLDLANRLGPEICLLKTHIDIIEDFTPELSVALSKLAAQHAFLIFEDRKFADIGNTVKHQYAGGIYRIADWADIINAHILPGPGIVEGLSAVGKDRHRGLVLLAEMSSAGHFMDKNYIAHTLAMAKKYPEFVMGFITQHAVTAEPQWINMTPGIQINSRHDSLGQQYTTPEIAIRENGSDIILVGRGILEAKDPLSSAQLYRQQGWDSYQARITQTI